MESKPLYLREEGGVNKTSLYKEFCQVDRKKIKKKKGGGKKNKKEKITSQKNKELVYKRGKKSKGEYIQKKKKKRAEKSWNEIEIVAGRVLLVFFCSERRCRNKLKLVKVCLIKNIGI